MTSPSTDSDLHATPKNEPYVGTPQWVYVFGVIALVLAVVFVVLHVVGGGFGNHMHGNAAPPASNIEFGMRRI